MNGQPQSKMFSKILTVAFAIAVFATFAALLTQGDALAFTDVSIP